MKIEIKVKLNIWRKCSWMSSSRWQRCQTSSKKWDFWPNWLQNCLNGSERVLTQKVSKVSKQFKKERGQNFSDRRSSEFAEQNFKGQQHLLKQILNSNNICWSKYWRAQNLLKRILKGAPDIFGLEVAYSEEELLQWTSLL